MKRFRTLVLSSMLMLGVGAALPARALSLSDLYYTPGQDGWGVNIIQQNTILFITIFVYASSNQPTWFVGPATAQQSTGNYVGPLYQTTGPYFGGTFSPSAVSARQVGTVSFNYDALGGGTLVYSVDGTSVTRKVVRQTWAQVPAAGTYYGTLTQQTGSTCNPVSATQAYFARFVVTATGVTSGTLGFSFATYQAASNTFPQSCTITAPYTQYGTQVTQTTSGTFNCYIGSGVGQALFDVQPQGITGVFVVANSAGTCQDTYAIFASRS